MSFSHVEVTEMYHDYRSHYASAHQQMLQADRAFNKEFDGLVDVPYEVRIFKSSTSSNIVEGFRNQIRTESPTVLFRPAGPSSAAAKHATLMKRWGFAQLRKELLNAVLDPNLQCGFDLLLRGAACKKVIVDVDRMMEPPPKRGSNAYHEWESRAMRTWPYVSKAIDPLSVFPPPGQKKPFGPFIERQVRYAGEIMDTYPEWKNPDKKKKRTRPVEWLEMWSEDEYHRIADDVPVCDACENPYGIVPYIFEWSGMGRSHHDADPRHMAVGILTGILGELEEEVRLKTAISVQTQMHVFPPILTIEDPRKVARQFGVGPGKVIRHAPGQPPKYMEYPPPNENFYRFLDVIHQNIARVFSRAMSGSRDPGVNFGVLQAQLLGQSLTTIAPVRNTLDKIGTQTLNLMALEARAMDLHTVVEGTSEQAETPARIKPSDFTHLNFEVTFEAVDPAENDRALLVGESLRRNGDISRETLWEKYAKHVVEDPEEEMIRLMEENTLDLLIASGAMAQAVLSEDVLEQMIEQAAESAAGTVEGVQQRRDDTVSEGAAQATTQLNTLTGAPGAANVPREVAQAGNAIGAPSQSGVPAR